MHIVIADSLPASAADAFRALGWSVDAKARDVRPPTWPGISRTLTRSSFEARPRSPRADRRRSTLRVIARAGTGVDNVDVAAASDRGVARHERGRRQQRQRGRAWRSALMLALARSIPAADASMKRGKWDKKKSHRRRAARKDVGSRRASAESAGKSRRGRARSAWTFWRTTRSSRRARPKRPAFRCRARRCAARSRISSRCTCRRSPKRVTC